MIKAGFAFLSPTPKYKTKHLYIILLITDADKALLVNLTTYKEGKDNSCVLQVGEHPYIIRESAINYFDAIITSIQKIEEAINMKIFEPQDAISEDLLKRILKGASDSPFLPKELKVFLPTE